MEEFLRRLGNASHQSARSSYASSPLLRRSRRKRVSFSQLERWQRALEIACPTVAARLCPGAAGERRQGPHPGLGQRLESCCKTWGRGVARRMGQAQCLPWRVACAQARASPRGVAWAEAQPRGSPGAQAQSGPWPRGAAWARPQVEARGSPRGERRHASAHPSVWHRRAA